MTSLGLVQTQCHTISGALTLESGAVLDSVTVAFETYGDLNATGDNVILITHALSGNAHAAGRHVSDEAKLGWWDMMIGPGRPFDTNRYFVVCSNVLGGCKGTTGPNSFNPKTQKPYGLHFPIVTIGDMVMVQKRLLDDLGVKQLHAVAGGSMGGMQALEWAVRYPEFVRSMAVIASTSRLSSQSIAFNEVGRNAIMSDPAWKEGHYPEDCPPQKGLAVARMIGHITYLSEEAMHRKFGRKLQEKDSLEYDFSTEFEVESYLKYQGHRFVEQFDANSYLYMTKAMDYFDLAAGCGSLEEALQALQAKALIVSYSSDWLFPTQQSRDIVNALMKIGKDVSFCEIKTDCGHDAFLVEKEPLGTLIEGFLSHV